MTSSPFTDSSTFNHTPSGTASLSYIVSSCNKIVALGAQSALFNRCQLGNRKPSASPWLGTTLSFDLELGEDIVGSTPGNSHPLSSLDISKNIWD